MSNRDISEGNLYHVMARGVGRQIIFEDDTDKSRLYLILSEQAGRARDDGIAISILAWCFMDNHVHLLVRMEQANLSAFLRTVFSQYARYFNYRHDRVGALFQDRFKSVPIKDDEQLLTVVRYIHNNPVEIAQPLTYRWSSYREYLQGSGIADVGLCLEMLGGKAGFIMFHETMNRSSNGQKEPCEGGGSDRIIGREALASMQSILAPHSIRELSLMEKRLRNDYLAKLKSAGLSIRQIELMTGIGRNIIQRA